MQQCKPPVDDSREPVSLFELEAQAPRAWRGDHRRYFAAAAFASIVTLERRSYARCDPAGSGRGRRRTQGERAGEMNGAGDDRGDLGIDIRLRTDVLNTVEQRNLAMFANGIRRTGTEPPPTKVLELLLAFAEKKIQKATREGNTLQGARALCDLECVLRDLVRFGHKEFEATLRKFEGGWRRCLQPARQQLVEAYLDPPTSPEEADRIHATLCEIVRRGAWPDWQREYAAAVDEAVARHSSPPIVPTKAN